MEIYCGLCGDRQHQLFTHLRQVHEMTPERYTERCEGAPLVSDDLATYMRDSRIVATEDRLKRQVELFGVEFLADILPGELVPGIDADYVLQGELCRQILISLKENEKLLLVGPTGCGKSTLVEQLAARLNWPVVVANPSTSDHSGRRCGYITPDRNSERAAPRAGADPVDPDCFTWCGSGHRKNRPFRSTEVAETSPAKCDI